MRESRTYGSVRGALSNERPYRDRHFVPRNDGASQPQRSERVRHVAVYIRNRSGYWIARFRGQ